MSYRTADLLFRPTGKKGRGSGSGLYPKGTQLLNGFMQHVQNSKNVSTACHRCETLVEGNTADSNLPFMMLLQLHEHVMPEKTFLAAGRSYS